MTTLSERASKELLGAFGMPVVRERAVRDGDGAIAAAAELGFPVALKLSGDRIAHKTERGLLRLGLVDTDAVREARRLAARRGAARRR